jgi:hypothetical protein
MRIYIYLIFTLIITGTSYAQYDFRAGMGISEVNTPSLVNYLNENYAPPGQQLGVFNSSIVFSCEAGYFVNDSYELSLDFSYLLNSYNFSENLGLYKLSYDIIMPSLVNYYVIKGTGYSFKFGGGIGPRFTSVDEQQSTGTVGNYNSFGFGILFKVEGNTMLSDNFYANIGFDLRYDFNGDPKNGSLYLFNPVNDEKVNFNSLSAGLHLGVSYIF